LGSGPVGDDNLWYHHIWGNAPLFSFFYFSVSPPPPGLPAGFEALPPGSEALQMASSPSQLAPRPSQLALRPKNHSFGAF